jgi:hypothetical protein
VWTRTRTAAELLHLHRRVSPVFKIKNRTASVLGLAAAAAIAVPAIAVASYQGSQPATTPTSVSAPQEAPATPTPAPWSHRGSRDGAYLDTIAQQLGVTTDVLKAAMQQAKTELGTPAAGTDPQTVRSDYLAALATALGIDQATVEAAVGDLPLGRFGDRTFDRTAPKANAFDTIAQQLGVTADVLKAAMQQAKTDLGTPAAGTDPLTARSDYLAALAAGLGIDQATVEAAVGSLPLGAPGIHGPRGGDRGFGGHGRRGPGGFGGFGAPNGDTPGTTAPTGSST